MVSNKCIHIAGGGRGNGGKDTYYLRVRNSGTTAYDGWWSVSYNSNDPAVTKKNESSHQKLQVKPSAILFGLNMAFSTEGLCLLSPSVNLGPAAQAAASP